MTTILYGMTLIDGQAKEAQEGKVLIIADERIEAVGESLATAQSLYPEARCLDLKGCTVLPGLIDAHVHLSLYGKPSSVLDALVDSATYTSIKAAVHARKLLDAGFTCVRSMGEKASADFAVKQAIEEGLIVGPRLLSSGKALSITGGHGDFIPGSVQVDSIGETCDGVENVRRATRERLKYKADNIKLMATGGGNSPGPGTVAQLTLEEMAVAVSEAETRGVITSAHAIGTEGIKRALLAGVRTIEHGSFIDDWCIDFMCRENRYLVPTLCAFRTISIGAKKGVPAHVIAKVKSFEEAHYAGLRKAIQAGVKIICGTDTGTPFNYHGEGAEELALYVDCGMTPMQAIQSATSLAAEALKLSDLGSLLPGYKADLLIVRGNPLQDMRLLQDQQRILGIVLGGRFIKESKEFSGCA